jgi:hypothetical protein
MASGFKQATVNASDVPSTQTDFPAYVDLSRLGITTLAEAQSVRVYADSGKATEWAREIVSATEMHVKVPSLTSTTVIYVDYDGVRSDYAVTDTYGRNAVWSDYIAVWHGNDTSSTTFGDSTANGFTATKGAANQPNEIDGNFGKAQDFSTNNWFASGSTSTTLNPSSNMTIQSWVYPLVAQDSHIVEKSNESNFRREGWLLFYNSTNFYFSAGLTSGYPTVASTTSVGTNTWYMLHGTYTPSTELRIYVNGISDGVSSSGIPASLNTTTRALSFGRRNNGFGPDRFLDAYLKEVRLRASTLSANWITTEHNNQSDEAGFWGTWSDVGGGNRRIIIV